MSAKGIKKINARYIIIFQESENATRLWIPHKSILLCVVAGLPLVVRKFWLLGENALKLKKMIEVQFKNSKCER